MDEIILKDEHEKRLARLRKERMEILSLEPKAAMERILNASHPVPLAHSFSDEDFYFLLQEIGPEDSLELLSLASDRQWEFILDIETWEKDKVINESITRWVDLLMRADSNRLIQWALKEKIEFFRLYLFNNIELKIREHDQDPGIFGDEYVTVDDVYYVRFVSNSLEPPARPRNEELRSDVLTRFLRRLADHDHIQYQHLLFEAAHVIPAESEEELFRLRNVRMAEKGFLPFDEAIAVYQPLKLKDMEKRRPKYIVKHARELMLPVPLFHTNVLKEDSVFSRSLELISTDEIYMQIQTELASLCNQIISADQQVIRDREALKKVVKKACGYLSIGLEQLGENGKRKPDPNRTAALVARYALADIFRIGFGEALKLKWRAEAWRKESWFQSQNLSLTFWGEQWLGILGGLFVRKPLFYDNYQTGVLYREFTSLDEVKQTERKLEDIIRFDHLLSLLNIGASSLSALDFFNYKNFTLTNWARNYLTLVDVGATGGAVALLELNEFLRFFKELWEPKGIPRRIKGPVKEAFLDWLVGRTGLEKATILSDVGSTLEDLFNEVESEFQHIAESNLDPRFVTLFLIRGKDSISSNRSGGSTK